MQFSAFLGKQNILRHFKKMLNEASTYCFYQMTDVPLKIEPGQKLIIKIQKKPTHDDPKNPKAVEEPQDKPNLVFTLKMYKVYITGSEQHEEASIFKISGDEHAKVIIKSSTINVSDIFFKLAKINLVHSWFMFNQFNIIGSKKIVIQKCEFATYSNKCNNGNLEKLIGEEFTLEKVDCETEDLLKVYESEIKMLSNINTSKTHKLLDGTFFLISDSIIIHNGSIIDSTFVAITNSIIVKHSTLSSSSSGCNDDSMKGSPHSFVSHSFNCGQNAGGYGGRGGIGISFSDKNSFKCMRSSLSRLRVYGDPFNPLQSGSKGASETVEVKNLTNSPSNIVIMALSFKLQNSIIDASSKAYSPQSYTNMSSGGGILLIYSKMIASKSIIKANGQESINPFNGEGGGGRIYSYDLCWHKKFYKHTYKNGGGDSDTLFSVQNKNATDYLFQFEEELKDVEESAQLTEIEEHFDFTSEAKAGEREKDLQYLAEYYDILKGEPGSKSQIQI